MISRAKTTPIDLSQLHQAHQDILTGNLSTHRCPINESFNFIETAYKDGCSEHLNRPEVSRRFEWFPKPQLYQLGHLRERIDAVENAYNEDIARFFRICLSLTARSVSYQRDNQFKRYRIPEEEWSDKNPDVLKHFQNNITDNIHKFIGLEEVINGKTTVYNSDSRYPPEGGNFAADMVITSPPYGDHSTTVAYGEFSLDQAVISMGTSRDRMKSVDKKGLGGNASPLTSIDQLRNKSSSLNNVLTELADSSEKRTADALSFFRDYYECIKSIKYVLRPGQPAVIVVGNRKMSRIPIPTDQISIELFEYLDFKFYDNFTREIRQKVNPSQNAPENKTGKTNQTMNNEYVLVFER